MVVYATEASSSHDNSVDTCGPEWKWSRLRGMLWPWLHSASYARPLNTDHYGNPIKIADVCPVASSINDVWGNGICCELRRFGHTFSRLFAFKIYDWNRIFGSPVNSLNIFLYVLFMQKVDVRKLSSGSCLLHISWSHYSLLQCRRSLNTGGKYLQQILTVFDCIKLK